MKKILVTGGNGQLGMELKYISSKFPEYEFIFTDIGELDITNKKQVELFFQTNTPDFCINCAAYTAVDKAEDEPEKAQLINVYSSELLARNCSKHNTSLIHISTDYVFDGTNFKPYNEKDIPNPNSVYGKTKLQGEQRVVKYATKALIIRTSWLYSAYGNNFVKTMLRLGKQRDELGVVVDQVGTPTYAGDLAMAIMEIISHNYIKKGSYIYHYSNEGVISWYDFAQAIFRNSGIDCNVNAIDSSEFPSKANRPFYSVLNKSKIKTHFNLSIPYWQDSLIKVIKQLETKRYEN